MAAADAMLEVESCETVLCIPGGGCLLNGYRHGDLGTSFWNPRFSIPIPGFMLCSLVFDDNLRKILEPKPGGSSSPLLFRLRYLTSCDSSRIT